MNNYIYIISISIFLIACSDSEVFMVYGEFVDTNNTTVGEVEIMEQGNGSNIRISLKGLKPGQYLFNFHENNVCNTPSFDLGGNKIRFFDDRINLYKFKVKKEINRYTGKIKDFNKIIFIENIFLDPKNSATIMDSNKSSIIISDMSGKRIICSEIYPSF